MCWVFFHHIRKSIKWSTSILLGKPSAANESSCRIPQITKCPADAPGPLWPGGSIVKPSMEQTVAGLSSFKAASGRLCAPPGPGLGQTPRAQAASPSCWPKGKVFAAVLPRVC